jgi:hypothetical protein
VAGHPRPRPPIGQLLRRGLSAIPGVRVLGPELGTDTLPVATSTVEGLPRALVAARLSAEEGIGVRHGCFCARPYLMRLLGLTEEEVTDFRNEVRRGDRTRTPGAVRASAGVNTTEADIGRLIEAVTRIAGGGPAGAYVQDRRTGDHFPDPEDAPPVRRRPLPRCLLLARLSGGFGPHGLSRSPAGDQPFRWSVGTYTLPGIVRYPGDGVGRR